MQRVSDRAAYTILLAVGALCITAFLVVRMPRAREGHMLGLDGKGYFSYLRSFVFDRDLDFRNEYDVLDEPREETPSTGLPINPYSVGPALLWAPFYLSAHLLSLMAHGVGVQVDTSGYGLVYQSAVGIATIVYATLGSFLSYQVCRRYFSPWASLAAAVGVWLASSLSHYTAAAPDMAHGVSFFTVSLFLFLWDPPRRRTFREWALLGCAAGLMALMRWQDVLFAGVLVVEGIQTLRATSAAARLAVLAQYLIGGLVVGLVGAAVFAPQMVSWNTLYGSPLTMPPRGLASDPVGEGFFDVDSALHPHLLDYLFSTRNGLYTWHPIMLLATVGFVPLWRRDRMLTVALLSALLLQWYINSALNEWWGGAVFGARRFICAIPVLALGMAALTEWTTERFRRGYIIILVVITALVGWNFLFELQFSWGFIPQGEEISVHQLTIGKFEMVLELMRRVISLF